MMPISGTAVLMARTARQTRLSRLQRLGAGLVARATDPCTGKSAIAGMPSLRRPLGLAHRLVDRQALDARHRGDRLAHVSRRRSGTAARSDRRRVRLHSRTSRRDQSALRLRRGRCVSGRCGAASSRGCGAPRRGSDGRRVSASGACGLSPSRSGQKECPFRSTNARCQKRRAVGATRGAALTLAVSGV